MPIVPQPAVSAALRRQVADWLAADPDPETRLELQGLVDAGRWDELGARFAGRLEFGTAGLRAELGAGPMRMNRLVVRQAAAGLLSYLRDVGAGSAGGRPLTVVVGFDARYNSDVFADDTCAVVAAAGGRAVRFRAPGPTPLLAFALRVLRADAGVMVTASHNPPADNGYKVYLADGAQLVPPHDEEIARRIAVASEGSVSLEPVAGSSIVELEDSVVEAYVAGAAAQRALEGPVPAVDGRPLRVVYTPLHGTGLAMLERAFAAAGLPAPLVVAAQAEPDPDFPTVAFPNPEEPGALDLALADARRLDADVVLANDPDADRLGVAVPTGDGGWRPLTGNEIGALLADHLLRHRPGGAERLVVTTVVSSRLLSRLAAAHGVHYEETLTGFKWIVRPALAHPDWQFTFGYEEALGYSVGPLVWDKDGISAAVVFAELTATLLADGSSPAARLDDLAREHGLHATDGWSLRFASRAEGADASSAVMARLRAAAPGGVGQPAAALSVTAVRDLAEPRDGLPPTEALVWDLDDGTRIVFRPSGTEPKLKVYAEVVRPMGADAAAARAVATARLAEVRAALTDLLA